MKRVLLALAAALLAAVAPAHAQDEADRAWAAGDTRAAQPLYEARLRADSADTRALHRVALLRAWAEKYDEALVLFDRLLRLEPGNRDVQVDRARVLAWRGDPARAAAALDPLLAADPGYLPALQARAQFASWAGNYDDALSTYGRIAQITPDDRSVGLDQARVLAWASRFRAAEAAYDSLLRRNPRDVPTLLGLGQVLSWAARLDSAESVYQNVLRIAPDEVEAQRGLARVAAWRGRLVLAEQRWRQVIARNANDATAWVGLSQTLRWQGRDAPALNAAERAVRIAPTDRDAREALRWARMPVAPRVNAAQVYETDSDQNRILTTSATAAYRPLASVELRADLYARQSRIGDEGVADGFYLDTRTTGGALTLWTQLEPGWSVSGTVGASRLEDAADPIPTLRATLGSPARYPVTAGLTAGRSPLDATAVLIANEVYVDELSTWANWAPAQGWTLSGGAGGARFTSRESQDSNERWNGSLAVARRLSRPVTLGLGVRAFGFRRDLSDGYFDPDFYGLAELTARWLRETRHWSLNAEVAPGLQKVRSDGDPSGSVRGGGSVAYVFIPGRRVVLSGNFANTGLSQLSTGDAGNYRYRSVSLSGAWTF
ncbi:MAG TPA: tetratricopeptide repeat protein [Longimicrobium sp.]|jgi:tetratricopeptide (TPR) repeat protein|uniref:tetratricopeptide repeat protein n=1 Tax=Longimicrobium sp. TaxID=2029185 RepID=UPI002EDB00B4